MKITKVVPVAVALAAAACAQEPTLMPAPGAMPGPDVNSATAEAADVSMTAWASAWQGDPNNLAMEITPVLVELRNEGTQPLRIRFNEFKLTHPTGNDFQAIPPFQIDEEVTTSTTVRTYPYDGFFVAPYLSPYYPYMDPFVDPWIVDRAYYDPWVTFWREHELPTDDMVQFALPEGVLEPGGVVTGFVYFEDVTDDPASVQLEFDLVTPDGTSLGEIDIPFRVSS